MNLIFTFCVGGIGTIVWYLITNKINRQDTDIAKRETETEKLRTELRVELDKLWSVMEEFKDNYLDRFEKVNTNINASRETILQMMHEIDKKIK